MSWSIGEDNDSDRFIGYGVPAHCDHPDCSEKIDRGLAHVCGSEPWGGDHGCGLFFCEKHLEYADDDEDSLQPDEHVAEREVMLCERCMVFAGHFERKPEHPEWLEHIATHSSWAKWRKEQKSNQENASA